MMIKTIKNNLSLEFYNYIYKTNKKEIKLEDLLKDNTKNFSEINILYKNFLNNNR